MIFALIKDGVVVNTVLADQAFVDEHYDDHIRVEIESGPGHPGVGWKYNAGTFSEPDAPVIAPHEETVDEHQERLLSEIQAKLDVAKENVQAVADKVGVVIIDDGSGTGG